MRIAILGASHWHVRLMYLDALTQLGEEIVAVADDTLEQCSLVAERTGCPRYTDYDRLISEHQPDFVWAQAPHCEMTDLALWLIARGVPFSMEKPMGLDWRQLEHVANLAAQEGVYASVALVSRHYGIVQWLKRHQKDLGPVSHYYYRIFAGIPNRYREWGVEWLLDPRRAGGGPLYNIGPHVIDLFMHLCADRVQRVSAHYVRGLRGEKIEDLCSLTMLGPDGEIGVGEVSYTMPDGYERYFSIDTAKMHCGGPALGDMTVQWHDGRRERVLGADFDDVYLEYTRDVLERFRMGQAPPVTIDDMVRTLQVMEAARDSAETGEPVDLIERLARHPHMELA